MYYSSGCICKQTNKQKKDSVLSDNGFKFAIFLLLIPQTSASPQIVLQRFYVLRKTAYS